MNQFSEWDFDNFRFIGHELFVYAISILLKHEAYDFAAHLMRQPYYLSKGRRGGQSKVVHFSSFRPYLRSLEHRNKRLATRRLSLHADLLEQRSHASGTEFRHLMQGDFVLYLRSSFDTLGGAGEQWWPITLLYAEHLGPFELFARAQSKEYFPKIARLFEIKSKADFDPLLAALQAEKLYIPKWEFRRTNVGELMNFDKLATSS